MVTRLNQATHIALRCRQGTGWFWYKDVHSPDESFNTIECCIMKQYCDSIGWAAIYI